ncbi:MAG TPA: pitrilysin family protein [Propionibacteriaceae bacterium]
MVTEHMPASRTFSIGIFVGVGSRQESARLHGASHFLEHVLFKGTRRRSAEEISASIEAVGGELNAYTAKEHTCFYARVQSGDADLAVDVLTDMISESLITAADLDGERAVILDEIAMHSDDPGEVVGELVADTMFAGSGLGQQVIGSPASIAALTRSQVVRHWRKHYQPSSLVVAAAGDLDHDHLVELLGPLDARPQSAHPRADRVTRVAVQGGLVTRQRRVEQCSAVLAFPGVGVFDPSTGGYDDRRYPMGLLSLVLGGGMASRLFVEVRERRGLTYGIDAGETAYTDAGLWSVDWQCAPDKLAEILNLVRANLDEVATDGVTETELNRAKGQIRGQTVLSYESAGARMSRHGSNALYGDERTLAEVVDRYDAVTLDDIQQEAVRLFSQSPVLGLVGPRLPAKVLRQWGG